MIICPECHCGKIKRNGYTRHGKQNHKCKECGRQFVLNNSHTITETQREIAERLLRERISLRGICRAVGVSITWMLNFAVEKWAATPEDLGATMELKQLKTKDELQLAVFQADEMWSFVDCKKNKAWIWVVYDPYNRQVIAFHVGGRGADSAKALWKKIPRRYRKYCDFATDDWEAYRIAIPESQHIVGKAHTHNIEGIFASFRARVSRLVRRSQSFSKKWENHVAAIGFFFWQFNLGF